MDILIVDDEEVNRLLINELLNDYFNDLQLSEVYIDNAKDGKEALELVDWGVRQKGFKGYKREKRA